MQILLFSILLPFFNNTEWIPSFSLHTMNYATIIVEGEIIDYKGSVRITEFYRGHLDSTIINIDVLSSPHKLPSQEYAPDSNVIHQHCILFLKEQDDKLVPASQLYPRAPLDLKLAMSMVWVISDSIYYGRQAEMPGPLYFSNRSDKKSFTALIRRDNKSIFTFQVATVSKNYGEKERAEILKASMRWTTLREQTIAEIGKCGKYGADALRELLPHETYTHEHGLILMTFVDCGGEAVLPELASIFQNEFSYWKSNIESLSGTPYWVNGIYDPRYFYLLDLAYLMKAHNFPDWQDKNDSVQRLFQK